jgi:hypothetical protein
MPGRVHAAECLTDALGGIPDRIPKSGREHPIIKKRLPDGGIGKGHPEPAISVIENRTGLALLTIGGIRIIKEGIIENELVAGGREGLIRVHGDVDL